MLPTTSMQPGGGAKALSGRPLRVAGSARPAKDLPRTPVVVAAAAKNPYTSESPLDSTQKSLAGINTSVLYAAAALASAAAGAAGYNVAMDMAPEEYKTVASGAAAVAGVAAGAAGAHALVKRRSTAASVELWNTLVKMDNPDDLTKATVDAVGEKYGINIAEKQNTELRGIYSAYLQSVIPDAQEPLEGTEAPRLRRFLDALGLSDEDAAAVHIDVARQYTRARAESADRQSAKDGQREFQKVIYTSTLLFGETKAAYLLPWKRLFNMTDSQINVAKRDNAKALFKGKLDALAPEGLHSDRSLLVKLRNMQNEVKLADDVAAEVVSEAAKATIVGHMDTAVACLKKRGRKVDHSEAVTAVEDALAFHKFMEAAGAEEADVPADERTMVPGVGAVSVYDTKYDGAARRELEDVYKMYMTERIQKDGTFSQELQDALDEIRTMMTIGNLEARSVREEVVSTAYRRALREKVQSGDLAAAESPAQVLQELCESVGMPPKSAATLHLGLYKQKLEGLLESGSLSDEDAETLDGLRRMMCIPKADVREAHKASCGASFRESVQAALGRGIDGFTSDDAASVKKAAAAVRLDDEDAKDILKEEGRRALMSFISASRLKPNKLDAAKELKRMVFFSNMVLSPLLETVKSEEQAKLEEAGRKEYAELMAEAEKLAAEEDAAEAAKDGKKKGKKAAAKKEAAAPGVPEMEGVSTLSKAAKAAATRASGEKVTDGSGAEVEIMAQKEITLAGNLSTADRQDIYRNYLMYCVTGDVVTMPMGGQIVLERDESEFARLSQLGDILGLQMQEVAEIHSALAEQAFRSQVQGITAGGEMSTEKQEKIDELRTKMGLSEETANKIIKGVSNEKMIGGVSSSGSLTLEKVQDLLDNGVDVGSVVPERQRTALYRAEVEKSMTSGDGEFDAAYLLDKLPASLALEVDAAKAVVVEYAKERRRTIFVQAASVYRQKRMDEAVKSLNNYVAATKLLGAEDAPEWRDREEVLDMYAAYVSKVEDEAKRGAVQEVLHITDEEAKDMQELVASGEFSAAGGEDDKDIF